MQVSVLMPPVDQGIGANHRAQQVSGQDNLTSPTAIVAFQTLDPHDDRGLPCLLLLNFYTELLSGQVVRVWLQLVRPKIKY